MKLLRPFQNDFLGGRLGRLRRAGGKNQQQNEGKQLF